MARLPASLRAAARRFAGHEGGATVIEYTLLTAIMALAVLTCMQIFSTAMSAMFEKIAVYYTLQP